MERGQVASAEGPDGRGRSSWTSQPQPGSQLNAAYRVTPADSTPGIEPPNRAQPTQEPEEMINSCFKTSALVVICYTAINRNTAT